MIFWENVLHVRPNPLSNSLSQTSENIEGKGENSKGLLLPCLTFCLVFVTNMRLELRLEKSAMIVPYRTIPRFDALKMYSCGKHCMKRRNCL